MARLASLFRERALRTSSLILAAAISTIPGPVRAQTVVTGAGASFPAPIYSLWQDAYRKSHPDRQINYQAIGSGGGMRQILEGTVDFGATDGPMSDKQLQIYKDAHGFGILHLPTVVGAAVAAYNIAGNPELNFTPEILAGIYLGRITRWDDPLLREANPKASLPSAAIVVVHRSEGSGTTYVWADYLSKVSDIWKSKVGRGFSVNWPVGLLARGNQGVAELIQKTPNSIGYVELSYALQKNIAHGRVRNSSGSFVKADLASVAAAAAEGLTHAADDFRISITNPSGKDAFPIASFSWVLIPARIQDSTKRQAIVDYLTWSLTDGQNMTQQLAYARVPAAMATRELAVVSRIQ
jgi:phosphate transport system substrate-binding protein